MCQWGKGISVYAHCQPLATGRPLISLKAEGQIHCGRIISVGWWGGGKSGLYLAKKSEIGLNKAETVGLAQTGKH